MALRPSGVDETWPTFQSAAPTDGRRSRSAPPGSCVVSAVATWAISDQVGVGYYEVGWGGLTAGVFREFLASLSVVLGDEPATVHLFAIRIGISSLEYGNGHLFRQAPRKLDTGARISTLFTDLE